VKPGKPTRSNPRQPPVITTQKDRARDDQQKRNWREVGGGGLSIFHCNEQ